MLYFVNTSTGIGDTLGYPIFDTADRNYFFGNLMCNSTTGKLYLFGQDDSVYVLSEITPNTIGFSQKPVFVTSTSTPLYSSAIDENTGFIYFVYSSVSGQYGLMKVNPTSGTSSMVGSYPLFGGGMLPDGLIYNNNDGLFYGFNTYYLVYPSMGLPQYVPFISIDPANGNVNTINNTPSYYYNGGQTGFDFCNNLYIFGDIFIEPSTGNVAKQLNIQIPGDVGVY